MEVIAPAIENSRKVRIRKRQITCEQYPEKNYMMSTKLTLSEGNKYLRLLQFDKAISCYDMILRQNSSHVQSLLGKAKCYMKLGRYKEAWTDFDKVLKINPKCVEAIKLRGAAEYFMGNFEKGFITCWKGYQITPFHDNLRLGYQCCENAIENSLNAEERMLLTEKDVIKLNKLLLKTDAETSSGYDNKGPYLADLKLLDDICKDKTLTALHSSCAELIDYLKGQQKFWKMQEPHKTRKSKSSIIIKNNTYDLMQMNKLIRNFGLCRASLNKRKTAICINRCNRVLNLLNNMSEYFSGKNEVEAETLHYLVMAYLVEEDFENAMKYCAQLHNIISEKGIQKMKGKALRDFGEIYYKSNQYEDSLNYFLQSLPFTENEEEKAAILYKISDCNVLLNNLKDAKDAAEKCLDLVVKHQNLRFQFDVLLLLAEIAVKEREMKLAEEYYRNALEKAVQNNDRRKKDLENLLEIFKEIAAEDSCSKERVQIIKITNDIKHTQVSGDDI